MSFFGDLASDKKDFQPIPEGEYVAEVTECHIDEKDKFSGKPTAVIEQTIRVKPYEGRKIWSRFNLEDDKKRRHLGLQLKNVTDSIESAKELGDVAKILCDELQGKRVVLDVTQYEWSFEGKKGIKNSGWIKRLADGADDLTTNTDDDLPF